MRKLIGLAILVPVAVVGIAVAVPAPKYFVCKYVGTPNVNETLQTGQNPISVSGNAINQNPVVIGSSFADAHGRSLVVAEDTGQDEPECPVPENDVCPNIDGNQETVPVGKVKNDAGDCVDLPRDNPEDPEQPEDKTTTPPVEETPQETEKICGKGDPALCQ